MQKDQLLKEVQFDTVIIIVAVLVFSLTFYSVSQCLHGGYRYQFERTRSYVFEVG